MVQPFLFDFHTTIEFGCGKSEKIGEKIHKLRAGKVLIVTDAQLMKLGLLEHMIKNLEEYGISYVIYDSVLPNPRAQQVDECAEVYQKNRCEMFVAVGGGSVMDVAKGAAVVAANGGEIMDYLLLRKDQMRKCTQSPEKLIAVPTTSGTGSEVSECIVITDKNEKKDLMLASELAPEYAVVDPKLTYGAPANITAMTGLDVLGHAVESYVSKNENRIAELFALEAIRLTFENLPAAVKGSEDAKIQMALASVYAGIAQSKNGCILPHAVSCPLSVRYKIPHGYAVGVAQIPSIKYTREVCSGKYDEIIQYLGIIGNGKNSGDILIEKIKALFGEISLNEKVDIGEKTEELLRSLAEDAMLEVDIEDCPRQPVKLEDLIEIYKEILV